MLLLGFKASAAAEDGIMVGLVFAPGHIKRVQKLVQMSSRGHGMRNQDNRNLELHGYIYCIYYLNLTEGAPAASCCVG